MSSSHARFEILAGALALGEATAAESSAFFAHAALCAACRADVEPALQAAALFAPARADETWRPNLENIVLGRIRDRRAKRSSQTVGALGWMVALSILLNGAFASGFAGQLIHTVQDQRELTYGAGSGTTMVLERRTARAPRGIRVPSAAAPPPALAPQPAMPGALAGFDVGRPAQAEHTLAFEQPPCGGYDFVPAPCAAAKDCFSCGGTARGFAGETRR